MVLCSVRFYDWQRFFFLLSSSLFLLFLRVPSSFCACMFCLSPLFLSFFPLVMARERGIVVSFSFLFPPCLMVRERRIVAFLFVKYLRVVRNDSLVSVLTLCWETCFKWSVLKYVGALLSSLCILFYILFAFDPLTDHDRMQG